MPPGMFLPVFEYCGMMSELDHWVTRQVVARLVSGSRVSRFSINVSSQTFGDVEFLRETASALTRAMVPIHALALEIRDEDVTSLPSSAEEFVRVARGLGFRLTLESFGRNAASLSHVKTFGFHYVKIDGVIVRALSTSQIARNKLDAIVRAAKVIGVDLIGECVETPEALEYLKANGVDYGQGFGIRQPGPIAEVAVGE